MTGQEDWLTQAVFMNRATSQNIQSSSSIVVFSPFFRFLHEMPRPRGGICCNTSSDSLPCTKRVITCRPCHAGKTAELVHYCSDFRFSDWTIVCMLLVFTSHRLATDLSVLVSRNEETRYVIALARSLCRKASPRTNSSRRGTHRELSQENVR